MLLLFQRYLDVYQRRCEGRNEKNIQKAIELYLEPLEDYISSMPNAEKLELAV